MTHFIRRMDVIPVLLASASLVGCGMTRDGNTAANDRATRAAIEDAYEKFADAFHRGDADAIASYYTEDARWYVPEAPVIVGRPAIAVAWKGIVRDGGQRLRVDVDEVLRQGDWASEVGRFTIVAPDGGPVASGKYIVIWKRQADGTWRTHRDIFNWDIPPVRP